MAIAAAMTTNSVAVASNANSGNLNSASVSALQFEKQIIEMRRRVAMERGNRYPKGLADLLLQRLKDHRAVTVRSVQEVLNAMVGYDDELAQQRSKNKQVHYTFPKTENLIKAALPLVKGRPLIENTLLAEEGQLLSMEGNFKEAAAAFRRSVNVITPIKYRIDLSRQESLYSMASAYMSSGRKAMAERAYLLVLSYDWPKVDDPEMQRRLKDIYVQAGSNLIALNSHNLKALKSLVFIPSTMKELGPLLRAAINQAAADKSQQQ